MKQVVAALAAGILFGFGLALSQMINPAKVLGFLDPFGGWDPSLALVMIGAVSVAFVGFRIMRLRQSPLLAPRFELPTRNELDGRLIAGAAIFGVGWGLTGYCPGPAIASLAFGLRESVIVVLAMALGAWLQQTTTRPNAAFTSAR